MWWPSSPYMHSPRIRAGIDGGWVRRSPLFGPMRPHSMGSRFRRTAATAARPEATNGPAIAPARCHFQATYPDEMDEVNEDKACQVALANAWWSREVRHSDT